MIRPILLWSNLILIATAVTLVTVLVGDSVHGYGLPLPWKTGGCPPPGIQISVSCLLAIGHDWVSFGLDIVFYTLVEYGLLLAYSRYRVRRQMQR
jgi:hypothetical protein